MQAEPTPTPPAPSLIRRIGRAVLPWPRAKKRKGADKTVLLLAALTLATVTGKAKSEDIYSTAVRAIHRCGIAEVPLPNGNYFFIFDPERNDIPVIPSEN